MSRAQEYVAQSKNLFEYWKNKPASGTINHTEGVFISDGIVDPDSWFSQEVRPLFLLKEAYNGDADWDLVNHLQNSTSRCGATWRRVSQWTEGLLKTTAKEIFPFQKQTTVTYGNEFLRQIAVMNVKKSGGQHSSDEQELLMYAEYDKLELYEQLLIIDPTVIICGYTIECLNRIMPERVKEYAGQSPNLFYFTELKGHPVLVLDYWHPSNQYPDFMNYYGLMGAYQQALKQLELEAQNDR